jgi:hypothetical protein
LFTIPVFADGKIETKLNVNDTPFYLSETKQEMEADGWVSEEIQTNLTGEENIGIHYYRFSKDGAVLSGKVLCENGTDNLSMIQAGWEKEAGNVSIDTIHIGDTENKVLSYFADNGINYDDSSVDILRTYKFGHYNNESMPEGLLYRIIIDTTNGCVHALEIEREPLQNTVTSDELLKQ